MTRFVHRLSITIYGIIILITAIYLTYIGYSYYRLPVEERFFSPLYEQLKPSGFWGHGLGIIGSLILLVGLFSYMARKRFKIFSTLGSLKYWLEFHIFMCTLGPVMILFHTTFKFGGIVSFGFWSMVIVWTSGLIGRFIYLQIPRTIEGRELSLQEVRSLKDDMDTELSEKYKINLSDSTQGVFYNLKLTRKDISGKDYRKIKKLIRNEERLTRRIGRLDKMRTTFKYWHFAHLPFALIMLIILVVHVAVVSFWLGYKWIF